MRLRHTSDGTVDTADSAVIRAMVQYGGERTFAAGADIKELAASGPAVIPIVWSWRRSCPVALVRVRRRSGQRTSEDPLHSADYA